MTDGKLQKKKVIKAEKDFFFKQMNIMQILIPQNATSVSTVKYS